MAQIADWFGRKFDFSFPVELYPDLCMRLRGSPARLEELVSGCAVDRLVRAPAWKWSAQEHVGHLLDLEPLWMARAEDFLAGRSELTAADLTNRRTHESGHNARALQGILADFRRTRTTFVNLLQNVDPKLFAGTMLHPRMKVPMRLIDHLFFVAEHDDHHLAIIWEMTRE